MNYRELLEGPFRRCEIRYWKRLLAIHPTITEVAKAAKVHRSFVYRRFEVLGIPVDKQNRGNAAWQSLPTDSESVDESSTAWLNVPRRHRPHLRKH